MKPTIDAHQHFWRYHPQRAGWITDSMSALRRDFLPGDLSVELSRNQVDASIAVQADQSDVETRFLLELAGQYPFIAGVVGWVDLCARDLPDQLESYSRFEKLRGFRHIAQAELDDRFLVRDEVVRGIGSLRPFGFAYDILIYPRQMPAALALMEKLPDQPFVIDHMAKPEIGTNPMAAWAHHLRALASNPSAYCKVSGLVTEADWRGWRKDDFKPYLDVAFDAFGTDRLMFGSDWPVCLLAGTYRQVKELVMDYMQTLPASAQENVFGANAEKFYSLKVFAHGSAA
jgi:L-fuconolactonase